MAAQEVVKQGYRWQVGNGNSIKIWTNKWLPAGFTFCVTSPQHALPRDAHVNTLIDHDTGNWRIGFIKEIFLPHDAQAILSTLLSIRRPPDRIVWAYTPNGRFTVNSAYKVALSLSCTPHGSSGGPSDNQNNSMFWKAL
ncbi:hypothetical protein SO802_007848 [Lithocarpus litseifolius]|uniref:Uncharacterized protein n=1 Tax=Lithocarpus litseifolius TaxID=425828 RepID=A0AAW2DTV3_9ROSI